MRQGVHSFPLSIFNGGVVKVSQHGYSAISHHKVKVTVVEGVRPCGDRLGLVDVIKYLLLSLTDGVTL